MAVNRLKQIRTARGLSRRTVAQHIGVHPSTYAEYESGNITPSETRQTKLAELMNISIGKLFPVMMEREPVEVYYPTSTSLAVQADVLVGDKMLRSISLYGMGNEGIPCTVVQTAPHWFRVRWDKSGIMECYSYQAFMNEKDLRRAEQ